MWVILAFLVGVVAAFLQPVIGFVVFGLIALARMAPRPRSLGLGASLLVVGVAACGPRRPAPLTGLEGPGTPAPPAAVQRALHVQGDSASLAAISAQDRRAAIDFAAGLEYADSSRNHLPPDRYHGQWDLNLLDTLGTVGLLQPQEAMHRLNGRQLGWDSTGRFELKITIVPSANHPVSEIVLDGVRLFAGVTYVWVDSMNFAGDSGTARALYIPADSTLPIQRRLLQVLRTPIPWNHAVARWTPAQCWDCVKLGWCHDGG